jgi:hypothetical protein
MTGFLVSIFPFRNRVSLQEAFAGLALGEGKPSRPVLTGPGGRKAAWLLGSYDSSGANFRLARDPGTIAEVTARPQLRLAGFVAAIAVALRMGGA